MEVVQIFACILSHNYYSNSLHSCA